MTTPSYPDLLQWAKRVPLPRASESRYADFAPAMEVLQRRGASYEQMRELMKEAGMKVPDSLKQFSSGAGKAIRRYRAKQAAIADERKGRGAR